MAPVTTLPIAKPAETPAQVPISMRLYATWNAVSYWMARSCRDERYGADELERLHAFYQRYAPAARAEGREKLAARYERKMALAREQMVQAYKRLINEQRQEGRYRQALLTVHDARRALAGLGYDQKLLTLEEAILTQEAEFLATHGLRDSAEQDLQQIDRLDPSHASRIRLAVERRTKRADGHSGRRASTREQMG